MDKNEYNRNTWIDDQLKKLPKGSKILDAGAGECKWKKTCEEYGLIYVSQDLCEYDGVGNGKGLETNEWNTTLIDIVSDITDIPVEDDTFDAVLCSEVLEHIPYPHLAIKELSRIMKSGGVLILTAPFCSLTHFAPYHYATGFNKYWYEKVLADYGFDKIKIVSNGNFFLFLEQEIKRLDTIMKQEFNRNSFIMKINCWILCKQLKKYGTRKQTTDELLCFGYFINAKKN